MDYVKLSNRQLYTIAVNDNARLKSRYAAAREMQRRKQKNGGRLYERAQDQKRGNGIYCY